ncbi:LytR/AlgR family response regulator transcription factor [Methylococcus mesophilus]|uniref:LytR/AlgR family response regulator transcription factor n=1 Tax=Methylococcus mesophilus TaxID=2993564 RepID=UPI00224B08EF|nr:LytTR family DNA-binding domain-containing protein [Methylococcus mesophilus]UZR28557.1 LytTR family DNA-binding domain-containing protein [Methylococcus mesophilus]
MTGLNVLVVDDEPLARRRLVRLLGKLDWVGYIEQAADVAEARRKILDLQPDLLLLDILMPGGSGFDVLEQLGPEPPIVVFVTAFDHHALRAFEANAVDYLTKPIEPGRFGLAMEKAKSAVAARNQSDRIAELQETIAALKRSLREQPRQNHEFWVKVRGEHIRIAQEGIIRFQAERDYVRIHVAGAEYLYHETLTALEQRLDPDKFIRIHRSAIVRCSAIARLKSAPFSALIAVLEDGSEIRVGRTYAPGVRGRLIQA